MTILTVTSAPQTGHWVSSCRGGTRQTSDTWSARTLPARRAVRRLQAPGEFQHLHLSLRWTETIAFYKYFLQILEEYFLTILALPIWLRSSSESVSVSKSLVSSRLAVEVATGNVGLQTVWSVWLNVPLPSWCRTISMSRLASELTDVLISESTVAVSPDILQKIYQLKIN